jgi:hypothetical protein
MASSTMASDYGSRKAALDIVPDFDDIVRLYQDGDWSLINSAVQRFLDENDGIYFEGIQQFG